MWPLVGAQMSASGCLLPLHLHVGGGGGGTKELGVVIPEAAALELSHCR